MDLNNSEKNHLSDIEVIWDLFINKSFISVFNDFLISLTDKDDIQKLIKSQIEIDDIENILNAIYSIEKLDSNLSTKELFLICSAILSNHAMLSAFIDFIGFNSKEALKNTEWLNEELFIIFSKKDINLLVELFQYNLNIYSKRNDFETDIIELRIKDKVDNIIWTINLTEPSLVLTKLWFSSVVKKWEKNLLINRVYQDSLIDIKWNDYIRVEDYYMNSYYIWKDWNVLELDNWRYLSDINKKSITDWYWLLMKVTDDFKEEYIVLNNEVFDSNYDIEFDEYDQKNISKMTNFSIKTFKLNWKDIRFYEMENNLWKKIFNQDFETLNVAWILDILWFDLDNDNILDSTYMFLDENLIWLEEIYDFDGQKFAKVKVRKQSEFSTVNFMSEEEREEYTRKERFFTFIIWWNWKILMSWEWNVVYSLNSKENILWKELISYSNWPSSIIDWYIDWNSNFVTIGWEILYDIHMEHLSLWDDKIYKINNNKFYPKSKLLSELSNYSWITDPSFQIYFNNDDNIIYNWYIIDELSVVIKSKTEVIFRFNNLWENISVLSYWQLIKFCKDNNYDELSVFINENLKKIS